MNIINKLPETITPILSDDPSQLGSDYRDEFDDIGWKEYKQRIVNYGNELYIITRSEGITRAGNEVKVKLGGKDVERAAMRLDFQRLYRRKQRRYILQIVTLAGSLLTGITTSWAFTNIGKTNATVWPWIILIILLVTTLITAAVTFSKDLEP